jgi:hypothetical protein
VFDSIFRRRREEGSNISLQNPIFAIPKLEGFGGKVRRDV